MLKPPSFPVVWHVYLVECADGTLYCGVTNDITKRLAAHNAGKGARYTRARLPVSLRYVEAHATRSLAQTREHALKAMGRAQKLALAATFSPEARIERA